MNLPLVSIVTPSLNQGQFIRATIESILSQDYENLEYLVMDGGSTDETLEILRSYGARLQWVSEPDAGQAQAVNKGWRRARGKILGWVNADDLLAPGAVRRAVEALATDTSLGGVYGDCAYIDASRQFLRKFPARPFDYAALVCETEDFIPQPTVFLRRAALEQAGFLDESLHYVLDFDLWLRLGMFAPLKYLPIEMAQARLHGGAKTLTANARFGDEMVRSFRRLITLEAFPAALRAEKNAILAQALVHGASHCFWAGETARARAYLWEAWQLNPFPRRRTFYRLMAFALFGKLGWRLAERLHGNPFRI